MATTTRKESRRRAYELGYRHGLEGAGTSPDDLDLDELSYYDQGFSAGSDKAEGREPQPPSSTDDEPGGDASPGDSSPSSRKTSKVSTAGSYRRLVDPGWSHKPVVSSAAGGFWAVIAFCLGANFIKYGWPGVTGWISAKFWNVPMGASKSSQTQHPTGGGPPNAPSPPQGTGQNLNPPNSGDTTTTPVM